MLNKRIVAIDGLRGVAILMVLLYHVQAWIPGLENFPAWYKFPVSLGFSGVDLFFVLSGFSLYYAWLRQESLTNQVSKKNYYWRRFWRIYPPYIIAFFLPWIPVLISTPIEALKEAFWHLLLIHNYSEKYFYGANGPLWSIAVEAQFYILFPLIIFFIRRWGLLPVVICGIVLGLIYRTGVYLYFSDHTYRQVPKPYLQGFWLARIPNFLLGMVLASGWTKVPQQDNANAVRGTGIMLFGLMMLGVTWIWIYFFRQSSMVIRELGFAIGYSLIVFGALKGGVQAFTNANWLTFTGKISYSLYLTHAPVILLLGSQIRTYSDNISLAQGVVAMLVSLLISYGVAWLFYSYVETPFFKLAKTYH